MQNILKLIFNEFIIMNTFARN